MYHYFVLIVELYAFLSIQFWNKNLDKKTKQNTLQNFAEFLSLSVCIGFKRINGIDWK